MAQDRLWFPIITVARELCHRLILIVAPAGSGKTRVLRDVSAATSAPLINVNLELSRRMLDLTERQRALQLPRLLGEFARAKEAYLRQTAWDLVVIDEAHRLRNVYKNTSKIAHSIKQAVTPFPKVLLTATPLQNSLLELYGREHD